MNGRSARIGIKRQLIKAVAVSIILFAAAATTSVINSRPAGAAPGDILRTFEAQSPACSVGVGIAFDGTELLVSCASSNVLSGVSPTDGKLIKDYPVAGLSGIGAISFDRVGEQIWLCEAGTEAVYTVNLIEGTAKRRFQSNGCFDGLAYDATDDTIWASPDVSPTITHYMTDGTILGTIDVTGKLGGCGNSGLAVGASELFLSNNGCSEIYRMKKDGTDLSRVSGYPARLEDLECDDISFPGTSVIWSKDAYDPVLNAFDVGAIDCGLNAYRDSDEDGISDTWETDGADVDGNGSVDLDLPAMGANPRHKDLFVEIDWLTKEPRRIGPISLGGGYSHPPSAAAVSRVVNAFKNWPVRNRDGTQGINLHVDAGQGSIMNPVTGAKWGARSRSNAIANATPPTQWPNSTFWSSMDGLRSANVEAARRGVFHYVVYVDELGCDDDGCITGRSRGIPGHDLLIARGDIDTDLQEAVTLAHELGHNLGLGHGGRERGDDPGSQHVNRKANYLSIMNYFYSSTGLRTSGGFDGIISFSSREHDPLFTQSLDEVGGLEPDPFAHLQVDYYCPNKSIKQGDSWSSINWNCDTGIANGSSNTNLQNADEVSIFEADPSKVFGSEDYGHLFFWGTGSAWDARNMRMTDVDQPGTKEPTVEEAKADGVWWPDVSVRTDAHVEILAYPETGSIDIPLTLENPGEVEFKIHPQLSGSEPRFGLPDASEVTLRPGSSQTMKLRFDTTGVTTSHDYETMVEYANADLGVLGSIDVVVHTPSADDLGPGACDQARQARQAADIRPEQIPALDAFLARCQNSAVAIDIKPGSRKNVINIRSRRKVPVAILGSSRFDPVSAVDRSSATFGRTGTEASLAFCKGRGKDVNRDGYRDLVCYFYTKRTGLKRGDTQAVLRGKTYNGVTLEGRDSVRLIT